jgi:hypothetical protein
MFVGLGLTSSAWAWRSRPRSGSWARSSASAVALYCVVVDAIVCSLFPLGTVLGVLALVTLSQPEGRARFMPPGLPGRLT